jgi:2-dehydro-3-deoxyphosphogalactonate aldolase
MTPAQPWPETSSLPLVAILRGIQPGEVLAHCDALVDAGFDCIEVPLNSPDWASSIRSVAARFGKRALIGGGTVMSAIQVDELIACGARLMVTPNTRPSLISYAVQHGLRVAAGFATASEAFNAIDAGAQMIKLFPATTYGPGHVKALRAVLPAGLPLLAVGGITPDNLGDYLRAGCTGAGLGSDLYKPGQDVARTRQAARDFVQAWRRAQDEQRDPRSPAGGGSSGRGGGQDGQGSEHDRRNKEHD